MPPQAIANEGNHGEREPVEVPSDDEDKLKLLAEIPRAERKCPVGNECPVGM